MDLPDRQETALKATAQAQGLSVEAYVQQMLDRELDKQAVAPAAMRGADGRQAGRPIWDVIVDSMKDVPAEDMAALPTDGASQIDHYVYGLPKR